MSSCGWANKHILITWSFALVLRVSFMSFSWASGISACLGASHLSPCLLQRLAVDDWKGLQKFLFYTFCTLTAMTPSLNTEGQANWARELENLIFDLVHHHSSGVADHKLYLKTASNNWAPCEVSCWTQSVPIDIAYGTESSSSLAMSEVADCH